MSPLVQIADDQNTDTEIVRLIGSANEGIVPLFTYLISEDEHGKFFLQVSSLNRNLSRFSPHPFDVIAMSQMLAIIEDRGYDKDALVSHVRFYEAQVLARLNEAGRPSTPFMRPSTGSLARFATESEIVGSLQLPSEPNVEDRRVGQLAQSGDAAVPVLITEHVLNHHILIAGSTGSGKSNILANLAHVASEMGRCIILFDHKPDHQDHHIANDDSQQPRAFVLSTGQEPAKTVVRYWTLDESDSNANAKLLGIPAREFDPEVLAGTIFDKAGEENQAEAFAAFVAAFDTGQDWKLDELKQFIIERTPAKIKASLFADTQIELHPQTVGAIQRKLRFGSSRVPSFIDRQPMRSAVSGEPTQEVANIGDVLQPGLNVIRVGEDDARGYALFLSRLLRAASEARARLIQAQEVQGAGSDDQVPEILILVDEAADIFKAESRYLRNTATSMLAERIRKGRSLRIGYVITVQDAGDVPENIRHNLNTTFVGRHRHQGTLRQALPTVREGLLAQADKLNPGEILLDMFGVPSLLLVKLDVSRSKLTVVR